jgi:GT2 family glycosyltransferase
MSIITLEPPAIQPALQLKQNPILSVMIPVYNCGQFIAEALKSVLEQGFLEEEMQIEVVDDDSTDIDVEALVSHVGKGRIRYYKQPNNVGSLKNFTTCINRAEGKLIHLLHGDDKVKPGYYAKILELFKKYPQAGAAFTRYSCIDENGTKLQDKSPEMAQEGILKNWLLTIGERQRIQYAAITVRRAVYEQLGGFLGPNYGEDWEMWVRIAKHYPIAYSPAILADYRMHTSSISGKKFLTGEHLQDLYYVMLLIQKHLPHDKKQSILNKSRKYYASYGIKIAEKLWNTLHDKQVVKAQIRQSLNLHSSLKLYVLIGILYYKITFSSA